MTLVLIFSHCKQQQQHRGCIEVWSENTKYNNLILCCFPLVSITTILMSLSNAEIVSSIDLIPEKIKG